MYRKKYTPQINGLPNNYSGWAATDTASDTVREHTQADCISERTAAGSTADKISEECPKSQIPFPALPSAKENGKELSDLFLIGAVLLLLFFQKKDQPKDPAVFLPLILLMLKK